MTCAPSRPRLGAESSCLSIIDSLSPVQVVWVMAIRTGFIVRPLLLCLGFRWTGRRSCRTDACCATGLSRTAASSKGHRRVGDRAGRSGKQVVDDASDEEGNDPVVVVQRRQKRDDPVFGEGPGRRAVRSANRVSAAHGEERSDQEGGHGGAVPASGVPVQPLPTEEVRNVKVRLAP